MRKFLACFAFLFGHAAFAAPAMAAPAVPSGELHEKLGVALALGDLCGDYRPYEYYFLHRSWQRQWVDSAAAKAITAKAEAAYTNPMGFIEAGKIRLAEERAVTAAYRKRATDISCANAAAYANMAKIEAYLAAGALVTQAIAMRGQAQRAPGMGPLAVSQTQIIGAFVGEARRLFGAQFADYERNATARAQAGLASYAGLAAPVAAAMMESEQNLALTTIQFDTLLASKKYSGKGAWLDDGTGLGRYAARIEDSKNVRTWRIEGPKAIAVGPAVSTGFIHRGTMVLMLRSDGAAVVGLYDGDFEKPGELTVAVTNKRIPPVAATALADCPVQQCFLVPAAMMAQINETRATNAKLRFFVTRVRTGLPAKSVTDGIEISGAEWKALTEAVRTKG